ncbi:MAG: flagellar basal body rod protein FlgC [Phycisphaerales bacterium]|nr:flagellar basal body rod protein FlgC [Phycisphaerales bacterium]NUQ66797.1 flagellar basal body rod protein FlgC [Phycisphaerales bacterium]
MYGSLDISTSGMIASRTWLTAISANLANRNSINEDGTPYRARLVQFASGNPDALSPAGREGGVHVSSIIESDAPFNMRFDPGDPRAIKSGPNTGYVLESNVNPVIEQINAVQASRAYEANLAAAEATKTMFAQALRLIA